LGLAFKKINIQHVILLIGSTIVFDCFVVVIFAGSALPTLRAIAHRSHANLALRDQIHEGNLASRSIIFEQPRFALDIQPE